MSAQAARQQGAALLSAIDAGCQGALMAPTEVLTHILVPTPADAAAAGATPLHGEWLRVYKISKRFAFHVHCVSLRPHDSHLVCFRQTSKDSIRCRYCWARVRDRRIPGNLCP